MNNRTDEQQHIFKYNYLSYLFLIACLALTAYLDLKEERQTQDWLVLDKLTIASQHDAVVFSISDGADDSYINQALKSGDARLLKIGTLYQLVKEFPDWYLIELVDRQRLYVAKSKRREREAQKLIM